MREAGKEICTNAPENDRKIFFNQEKQHHLDKYFLDSANKIHYFYENGALDDKGNLLVDKSCALNKVYENFIVQFRKESIIDWWRPLYSSVDKTKIIAWNHRKINKNFIFSFATDKHFFSNITLTKIQN